MSALDLQRDLERVVALTGGAAARRRAAPSARAATTRLERARHELSRVQRAELALLLRRAAELRLGGAPDGLPTLADGLLEVLALAACEGWRWPRRLERLLQQLIHQPCERWPSALRLARAAQALWPCLAARLTLAEALAAAGARRAALGELAGALVRLPRGARPRRLVVALGRHLEAVHPLQDDPRLVRACTRLARRMAVECVA